MTDVVATLTDAFTLSFVLTSMFSLGLGLTVREILEPLRNLRLVLASLLASFVIVPAAAYGLAWALALESDHGTGLILMSTVAGAPLALKATQMARGNIEFSASLGALQVVVTVVYLPFALPLLIRGVEVDAVAIALPLVLQILVPLAPGMLMTARYDEEAEMTRPIMNEISNLSLALMLVLNLGIVGNVLALIGTGSPFAVAAVILVGLGSGYLLGGPDARTRPCLVDGTAAGRKGGGLMNGSRHPLDSHATQRRS